MNRLTNRTDMAGVAGRRAPELRHEYEIARAIIEDQLKELPKLSYGESAERVGRCDCIDGPDQNEYQVETEVRWDSMSGANIRVMVAADGARISAFRPVSALSSCCRTGHCSKKTQIEALTLITTVRPVVSQFEISEL